MAQPTYCLGMARWKRAAVAAFLDDTTLPPIFVHSRREALHRAQRTGGRIVVWAAKADPMLRADCAALAIPLIFMEDGFLRSRGLGSAQTVPASLVLDRLGIYYDPTWPSDLEIMLETADIPAAVLQDAVSLRALIVANRLTKYNVGAVEGPKLQAAGRRVLLVAGQVGDDASIRLGTGPVRTNLNLLRTVRAENPDAFILYKPHPDVEFGRRYGYVAPHVALRYANQIASGRSADVTINQADEVCVMTSLLGFEALLRGKPVTCYGMPFYAGWGLTNDRMHSSRRTRRRSLDEVFAAAYLLYSRYIDTSTLMSVPAHEAALQLIG